MMLDQYVQQQSLKNPRGSDSLPRPL